MPALIAEDDVKSVLQRKISERLGRTVNISIDDLREVADWMFVCGRPLEMDGRALEYSTTSLKSDVAEGLIDDYYCALVKKSSSILHVQELSVGTTDMPMFDWIEKYGLPESLLVAPDNPSN